MSKSDYLENELLDHSFGGGDYARPDPIYFALFTAAPSDSGGGTEVTGGSYARKSMANDGTTWAAASGGSKTTVAAVTFVTATASWGTVTHFGVFDASSGGNLLRWGALSASKVIGNGDTANFPAGSLTLTED